MAIFERRNKRCRVCALRIVALAAVTVVGQSATTRQHARPRARRGAIQTCRVCGRLRRLRLSSGPATLADKQVLTEQEAADAEKTYETDNRQPGSARWRRDRCRRRSRLQRLLVGSRNESRLDASDVAGRRSAGRTSSAADRRKDRARATARASTRLRFMGGPKPVGALHHARAADDSRSVQQQLSDSPDAWTTS